MIPSDLHECLGTSSWLLLRHVFGSTSSQSVDWMKRPGTCFMLNIDSSNFQSWVGSRRRQVVRLISLQLVTTLVLLFHCQRRSHCGKEPHADSLRATLSASVSRNCRVTTTYICRDPSKQQRQTAVYTDAWPGHTTVYSVYTSAIMYCDHASLLVGWLIRSSITLLMIRPLSDTVPLWSGSS